MRLNLLPTTVKKGTQVRAAWFISVIIAGACIALAVFMVLSSKAEYDLAKEKADAKEQPYQDTKKLQQESVDIMSSVAGLQRNVNLYNSMDTHIDSYPDLYNGIKPYIPNFFRITEMNATAGKGNTVLTLTGVIGSYQDYADLMLALLRIPKPFGDVQAISRAGFQHNEATVPPIDQDDPIGRPHKPGVAAIPNDPLKRLEYLINQGSTSTSGFQGVSLYGSGQTGARGARPNESLVTVQIVLPYDIETPDPRATLNLFAGGGGTSGGGAAQTAPGGGPPAPGPRSAPGGTRPGLPAPGGGSTGGGGKRNGRGGNAAAEGD